jgi:hypothetical protein
MTTPMSVYSRVATRYGVDPADDHAVDEFFIKVVPLMPAEERDEILKELLRSQGGKASRVKNSPELPSDIPLMSLGTMSFVAHRRESPSIDDRLNRIIHELIGNGITLAQAAEAFEGKYIVAAMNASHGNVTQASRRLGVHRSSLHNKLRTQTMLNGFAESVRPVRRRVSHKRVSSPGSVGRSSDTTESHDLPAETTAPKDRNKKH